jgi:hypothetical protein
MALSTEQFLASLNLKVEQHLNAQFEQCSDATKLGLDRRAGYDFYVGDQHIAVKKSQNGSLRYYGVFEYVDADCVQEAGEYVFYSAEDGRVAGHLDTYHDRVPLEPEEE